jgi:hypothetical protein
MTETWGDCIKTNFSHGILMGLFLTLIMVFLYTVIVYGTAPNDRLQQGRDVHNGDGDDNS